MIITEVLYYLNISYISLPYITGTVFYFLYHYYNYPNV